MAKWTDNTGQDWTILVNVATARRVKELAGVDLLDVFDGSLLTRLAAEPVTLVEVLFGVCVKQAETRQIDYEQFATLVVGDSLESAIPALVQAITDFFPSGRREILRRLWERVITTDRAAVRMAADKMSSEAVNRVIQRTLKQAENQIDQRLSELGSGSLSVPESVDSTPGQ